MDIRQLDIERAVTTASKIVEEISRHMIGQKELIKNVTICILAGGNLLLEGVPGLGKTRLVKVLGKVLGLDFSRIQFTPDLMPADIIGTNIISRSGGSEGVFKFQPGPVFSNIVLADEINRATPKTQSALLEAMQEQTVTISGVSHDLPKPFFVLATQNPIEMEGTYPLPEAQMDRFLFKLNVPFPTLEELHGIVDLTTGGEEPEIREVTNAAEIQDIKSILRAIPVARPVVEFALKIVLATHPENSDSPEICRKFISYGSSPRGAQAIISSAKVRAALEGRYNVSFDDIRHMAYPALRHRIFLNFDARSEDISTDFLIGEIINILEKEL